MPIQLGGLKLYSLKEFGYHNVHFEDIHSTGKAQGKENGGKMACYRGCPEKIFQRGSGVKKRRSYFPAWNNKQ